MRYIPDEPDYKGSTSNLSRPVRPHPIYKRLKTTNRNNPLESRFTRDRLRLSLLEKRNTNLNTIELGGRLLEDATTLLERTGMGVRAH